MKYLQMNNTSQAVSGKYRATPDPLWTAEKEAAFFLKLDTDINSTSTTGHKIDFSTYEPESGRTHLHKNKSGEWVYVTRTELYAAYQHQPDPEGATE